VNIIGSGNGDAICLIGVCDLTSSTPDSPPTDNNAEMMIVSIDLRVMGIARVPGWKPL
jgi:hypothetical protein